VNGVFFCYRIPAPIEVDGEVTWTTDDHVGESRWFFFDFDEECIIEGAAEMHRMNDVIQCDVEQERNIQAAPEQLLEAKKKVLKHIKNSVLRNLQAPIGTQPRLVTWMAVSRPSF